MANVNKERYDAGTISIADYKQTEDVRLDAEIGLLREKAR
jgi:hypothetical protein